MTTLVVCLDRTDDVGRKTGLRSPIVGWEAVRALVTDIGLADPEDSGVNTLLETLRVAQSLRDEDEETVVAVVSGDRESMVSADRAVARQLDELIAEHDPDSAVVVIDSAEDERLVPIVESRVRVDSVDRVVVRQARDIESTYYLLKQFLADEELRQTVLIPVGLTLLVFPMLATVTSPAEGAAAITTVIGLFLLYKGFNIDEIMTGFGHQVRESLYSGQVSVVTYVVAAGLTLVGLFFGALGVSNLDDPAGIGIPAVQFAFDSVPWLAMAALTASAGRLLDEVIGEDPIRSSYLNLPFIVVAVGLVVRGFTAYFLEQQQLIDPLAVPPAAVGPLTVEGFSLTAGERLAVFVVSAILISLLGAWIASAMSGSDDRTNQEGTTGDTPSAGGTADTSSPSELTDGGPGSAGPLSTPTPANVEVVTSDDDVPASHDTQRETGAEHERGHDHESDRGHEHTRDSHQTTDREHTREQSRSVVTGADANTGSGPDSDTDDTSHGSSDDTSKGTGTDTDHDTDTDTDTDTPDNTIDRNGPDNNTDDRDTPNNP
ncbi:DUF373 family protein [Natrialba magadii ATCC 43099]|uniref:DUF373 family protein n=1 Tax=Natrialba magadii (strain ATCC 43099 / DSM 3394 / CCM 3739 / CIP 104546 / IAM 13178 / JCM 8861 / NBRC 102185 / NCIMB 2190 / MS3) TaxID=547559 RepID=D3SYX8_NATMM|nr:DUF373 family protein [Natrialba magadii]ADD06170.1 DUF373 family protein [Natrialba magadii ATCC 43099]